MNTVRIEPSQLAQAVSELVQIPSVNPIHDPASDEIAIAEFVAARMTQLGAEKVVLDPVIDGRCNVYGYFPGTGDRTVALDVHLDTVSVANMTDPPFDGRIADGAVWGRGALDTKASMGVMLSVLEQLAAAGQRPSANLWLIGTVGEEAGGLVGALRCQQWAVESGIQFDEMIIAEPTQLSPLHGHKGAVGLRATAVGRSAHTAIPHLGENAIDAMLPVLAALKAEAERLATVPPTTEIGHATLTVAMINGGIAVNIVPDRCTISLSQRLVPGESPDEVYHRLEDIITTASPLPVEIEPLRPAGTTEFGANAFYQPADTPLVQHLARLAGTQPTVAPFGTNAMRYDNRTARAMVVFGPGSIDDAHLAQESVTIDDLARLADIYIAWLDAA